MKDSGALESLLRRDRFVILAALAAVSGLALTYVVRSSNEMTRMAAMDMPRQSWTVGYFASMLAMWLIMMIGMMLPTVAPVVLLYAGLARRTRAHGQPLAPPAWFAAGYLLAWSLFSVAATLAQWALESLALLTPVMAIASVKLAGLLLIGIGAYQWLPVKRACLSNCRSPLSFIQRAGGFQSSPRGAVRLGMLHGLYCIGCCWALMCLLFVGGVMNLLWIALSTMLVLTEKLLPAGRAFSAASGLVAVIAGLFLLLAGG